MRVLFGLVAIATSLMTTLPVPVVAQETDDEALEARVKALVPGAQSLRRLEGSAPVWEVYGSEGGDPGNRLGLVFRTSDFPPEEIGYSGPIRVLVGMDPTGVLTGIDVLEYHESYRSIRGDFLATEQFQPQFRGMTVQDSFAVGRDVDGVSRATITSWATARGIRNAARAVARNHLPGLEVSDAQRWARNAAAMLQQESWESLRDAGWVRDMIARIGDGTVLQLSVAFLGSESLAEVLIGNEAWSVAQRGVSANFDQGRLVLVAVAGDSSEPFRQESLSMRQDGQEFSIPRRRFVYAGGGDEGLLAGHARYAGAIVVPEAVDLDRPYSIIYTRDNGEVLAVEGYRTPPLAMALLRGEPILTESEQADQRLAAMGPFTAMIMTADPLRVALLSGVLALAMTAFFSKMTTLRWVAAGATLLYLGFLDGGFLSISHVTNLLKQGPVMLTDELPLMMLVVFTLLTTLLWGRIFCSSLCPFGALQDLVTRIVPGRWQQSVPGWLHRRAVYLKYVILMVIVAGAFVLADVSFFQYFEPFGTLFYFSPSLLLWSILLLFAIGFVLVPRFYCRYFCPLGAALGMLSAVSPFRIRRVPQCTVCRVCERDCPTGAISGAEIDFRECVRCDICERRLLDRAGTCRHDMDTIRVRMAH